MPPPSADTQPSPDYASVKRTEQPWPTSPLLWSCHAPGVLRHVNTPTGHPLVEGKNVTGLANSEEEAVGLTDVVPFLVEDELKALGGVYSRGPD